MYQILNKKLTITKKNYDNIFIVENRDNWRNISIYCNKETDLILCVDFGIKKELFSKGYNVEFLDHLTDSTMLEKLNYETHNFLNNWYKDENGNDILEYNGYNIGDSLLLYLINDVVFICHYFFNILAIKDLIYNKLYVATDDTSIIRCLDNLGIIYSLQTKNNIQKKYPIYYFPMKKWVQEKVNPSFSFKLKNLIANIFDIYFFVIDKIFRKKRAVYIQNYYPTRPIIREIDKKLDLRIILPNYPGLKNIGRYRRIHFKSKLLSKEFADRMFLNYLKKRSFKWVVFSYPVSDFLQVEIELVLKMHLLEALNIAQSIEQWMKNVNLKLMIPITNLWTSNRLLMQYCVKYNIPTFTIINGLLNISYYDDAKDSNYVNSYSNSIKNNYFANKNTVLALGDPRMDQYLRFPAKKINWDSPTIIIGAAAYDSLDLNSYIAYEFDFLYDILYCIQEVFSFENNANIIIKVRGNGYLNSYIQFIDEYFNNLKIKVIQENDFFEIISKADLYITFYSQTIIEASCLGIPVIYYKKDTMFIHEPFDDKGELVTANNINELNECIQSFSNRSTIFNEFMQKSILEKYIGPLDGKNTDRNIEFIDLILNDLVPQNHVTN